MTKLEPGVVCFLAALIEYKELNGRVVVVESGPLFEADGIWRYRVAAAWVEEDFPGCELRALRANLMPIVPPGTTPPAARKSLPVTAE